MCETDAYKTKYYVTKQNKIEQKIRKQNRIKWNKIEQNRTEYNIKTINKTEQNRKEKRERERGGFVENLTFHIGSGAECNRDGFSYTATYHSQSDKSVITCLYFHLFSLILSKFPQFTLSYLSSARLFRQSIWTLQVLFQNFRVIDLQLRHITPSTAAPSVFPLWND